MFSSSPNYTKLKTHLRLAINRLKLLEKKKTELTQKARKEIADYIQLGKYERAKIRVEHIIREDYLVEAMEIVEMYCDLILARFGLITQMKALDEGIAEPISSILWVAPRLQSDIQELKIISDILTFKYGKPYADSVRNESVSTISEKLKHKLSIQSPPKLLVEKYIIEIAKNYNIPYEPDPNIMKEEPAEGMMDAFLIDLSDKNNLGGGGGGGGGGMPQPPGFVGYPQAPSLPSDSTMPPFGYPPPMGESGANPGQGATAPHHMPYGAPFSYNIPPGIESKEQNVDDGLPPYNAISPDDNLQNRGMAPKPLPRSKMNESQEYPDLPNLPSVPSDNPLGNSHTAPHNDDIDFDDLTRRFEELKKKK